MSICSVDMKCWCSSTWNVDASVLVPVRSWKHTQAFEDLKRVGKEEKTFGHVIRMCQIRKNAALPLHDVAFQITGLEEEQWMWDGCFQSKIQMFKCTTNVLLCTCVVKWKPTISAHLRAYFYGDWMFSLVFGGLSVGVFWNYFGFSGFGLFFVLWELLFPGFKAEKLKEFKHLKFSQEKVRTSTPPIRLKIGISCVLPQFTFFKLISWIV